jgi:hypothetical protein
LFLTAALRGDGASSFGNEFKTAAYPKASLSWLASDEPWMPHIPTVDRIRIRAAYGGSGTSPSPTAKLATVTFANALVGGTQVSAAVQNQLGNPNLGPERQTEFETGADIEFGSGRASLELTYYNRQSKDALVNRPLPYSSGLSPSSRLENIGKVRNLGYEGNLNATLIQNRSTSVSVNLNGSVTYNKLVSLGSVASISSSKSWLIAVGYPLYSAWDTPILGFEDKNNNGIIEGTEIQMGTAMAYKAPTNPTQQLTSGTTIRLFRGKVTLNTMFDYRGGYVHATYEEINRCVFVVNSCLETMDKSTPLAGQVRSVAMRVYNSWWGFFEDGSFTRWRELGITMEAPNKFARVAGAKSATLTLTGRNLHIWTKYTGVDPEINSNTGTDFNSSNPTAPQTRYWLARIQLGY